MGIGMSLNVSWQWLPNSIVLFASSLLCSDLDRLVMWNSEKFQGLVQNGTQWLGSRYPVANEQVQHWAQHNSTDHFRVKVLRN